jgi:hypothetical protein
VVEPHYRYYKKYQKRFLAGHRGIFAVFAIFSRFLPIDIFKKRKFFCRCCHFRAQQAMQNFAPRLYPIQRRTGSCTKSKKCVEI